MSGKSIIDMVCPVPFTTSNTVLLGHGSGGKLSNDLVRDVFLPAFGNPELAQLNDQAVVRVGQSRIAITTDSFVIRPLFFRGGDIGSLAVHGTVNDLAVGGALPLFLTAAFIIEEGLPMDVLRRVAQSMQQAAKAAGVRIVAGDTKVVERGKGDGIFINTTGIGLVPEDLNLSADRAQPGDVILLSGSIGEHGIAILAEREGLEFESALQSDSAPLHELCAAILSASTSVRCMRDLTRGGLSSAMNEIAAQSNVGIELNETAIPVRDEVRGACEMLGLDPLYVANEGKLIAIVPPDVAHSVLRAMRANPRGENAQIVGRVTGSLPGLVTMKTPLGTSRIVDMLAGDQLPRIC
ncbi:MAG TPA: hydrogenase expression/formation protein HypE [Terracidiphilus sp.]|jgi:hydrogenase expression/formation protein HypE|nr:hydrogenase expression/formation protein HypE [Terracidiphilus sp.]